MKRQSTRVFIRNKDGLYLALFQINFGKYILPGGKCEPGESFIDCVIRETKEETNLILKNIALIYEYRWPKEQKIINQIDGFDQNYYIADADLSELKIMEPNKHSEYKFLPLEHISLYQNKGYQEIKSKLNDYKKRFVAFAKPTGHSAR